MRRNDRVRLREDPGRVGRVFMANESRAFVVWEGDDDGGPVDLDDLEQVPSTPPLVHAPEIADLQYVTRIDPDTDSVYMERADSYRGRRAPLPSIEEPVDLYEAFRYMGELDREHIVMGLLNIRNELMGWKVIHVGELAAVEASGRQIIRDALLGNAAGVFVLHNHPTGDPRPSDADKQLTKFLEELAKDLDVCFFDHVIVGCEAEHHEPYYSFREDGKLQ